MQWIRDLGQIVERLPRHASIVLHSACAEPRNLVRQLLQNEAHFVSVRLITLTQMNDPPYASPATSEKFFVTSLVPGRGLRRMIEAGRGELVRRPLSESAALFRNREIAVDVLLLQLSPPDRDGMMSLGLSVDIIPAVLSQKPLVIAEINRQFPRTRGDTRISQAMVDFAIEVDTPPYTVEPSASDPIDLRIAQNVAGLIPDRSTVQTGIGSLPDLLMGQLHGHRDLGIYSGIVTDSLMPLVDAGVVTNAFNGAFPGRSIATVACGSAAFYAFLADNPAIELHPCSITHDPARLAAIPRLVAVNSALEVDLSGRVNAESLGRRVISAPGGLPDFARGATLSQGGISIIALRATSKEGDVSRIRGALDESAPITATHEQIDYVVTEFGAARLSGAGSTQRAHALASVAHPDFRDALLRGIENRSL